MRSIRTLLEGLVDYAGLFPPARQEMAAAVDSYARYRQGEHAWMLGRLVVPLARLDELLAAVAARPDCDRAAPWPLSLLPGDDLAVAAVRLRELAYRPSGLQVSALELPVHSAAEVEHALAVLPEGPEVFFELPVDADPGPLLAALRGRGRAKVRTGGITADAIPSAAELARFLLAAAAAGVPFKATAGLHHALRGRYPLTYEANSPSATMHGFLNLFLAAAFVHAGGWRDEGQVRQLLEEEDPAALACDDDGLAWRGHRLSLVQLAATRRRGALSFGSCSFAEPVAELGHLGLLAHAAAPVVTWAAPPVAVREPEPAPPGLDATHDPERRSWVESANRPDGDFPLQNLPFGLLRARPLPHLGVAIGDQVLDLAAACELGLLDGLAAARACRHGNLNYLMTLPAGERRALRHRLSELLSRQATPEQVQTTARALRPQAGAELLVPVRIGDYTDFYASVHHATHVGSMLRPDNPLLPNYKYLPVGYHGRASSVVVSGTPVRRPLGQSRPDPQAEPLFGPSRALDYELEVGLLIGPGNAQGEPVPIARAGEHLFGVCLLNDWSARDLQTWEYQPLGPFLAKSFATSVSPWVVTTEALAPFRVPAFVRPAGDPQPLPYLDDEADRRFGAIDLHLEVWLSTARMRDQGREPVRLSRSRMRDLYWTPAQMIAHHSSNGCNLKSGDLLGSGTVSGPEKGSRGCLLELTWRGAEPLELPGGEQRKFLEDGDEVLLRGFCQRPGHTRIGLGECRGRVEPAPG